MTYSIILTTHNLRIIIGHSKEQKFFCTLQKEGLDMRLTKEQKSWIKEWTKSKWVSTPKMIAYLESHDSVSVDIFSACCSGLIITGMGKPTYNSMFEIPGYFDTISIETFLKRLPFYFYIPEEGKLGDIGDFLGKNEEMPSEEVFQAVEYLYYDIQIPLVDIFDYPHQQVDIPYKKKKITDLPPDFGYGSHLTAASLFSMWYIYIRLCRQLGWDDLLPDRFITKYNQALEAVGVQPIIYMPVPVFERNFIREGHTYSCVGNFPCDENNNPIMKWIGVRAKNAKSIRCDVKKSQCGKLTIELLPNTIIHALNIFEKEISVPEGFENTEPEKDTWNQIYAGPMHMHFNNEELKFHRQRCEMTQKELAEAVGTSVRTYQKWENRETTPDGHNLLRLMNWLGITDVQELIKYDDYECDSGREG